jgi:hypothetical protein
MGETLHRRGVQHALEQRATRGSTMLGMIAELHDVHDRRYKLAMSLSGRYVATTGKVVVPGYTTADALLMCGATPTTKLTPPAKGSRAEGERIADALIVGDAPKERALALAAKHGLLVLGEGDLQEILRVRLALMAEQRITMEASLTRARKQAVELRAKGLRGRRDAEPVGAAPLMPGDLPTPDDYREAKLKLTDGFRSRRAA